MKGLNEKYLLKRAFASAVPESVRLRKKQPYRAPDADSFFSARAAAASRSYVDDLLSIGSLKGGVFEPEGVERLVRKARAGAPLSTRDNMAVVAILSTELLRAKFIDRFQPPDATAGPIVSAAVGN
jgi:asparagine synthase (glutamine-hydrolysing)